MDPLFVVFEGIDRCGKTEQAKLLAQRLRGMSVPAEALETPDRSLATGKLATRFLKRQVELVETGIRSDSPLPGEEALVLHCVLAHNRSEVAVKVRAHLRLGASVTCARWWPSSLVYGCEDGLDPGTLTGGCALLPSPDLCVLLDVDPASVAGRLDRRQTYEGSDAIQERLAASYLRMWRYGPFGAPGSPPSWVVVDGRGSLGDVAGRVWGEVCKVRPELQRRPREETCNG